MAMIFCAPTAERRIFKGLVAPKQKSAAEIETKNRLPETKAQAFNQWKKKENI